MNRPYKIGLTGGIGSGKTTISKIFQSLGVPVFNSDLQTKKILQTNKKITQNIIKKFGQSVVSKNEIDKKKLSSIVFNNSKKLELLNSIIHPEIIKEFHNWYKKQKYDYIIKESALLFEANTYQNLDKIILVKAPLKLRIKRIIERDNKTQKEIQKIINKQVKVKNIINRVDYIINNNCKQLITNKIIDLDEKLRRLPHLHLK